MLVRVPRCRGSDIEPLSGGGRKNYPVNVRRPAARLITTNLPVSYKQKQVPHKFSAGYIVDVIMTTKLAQINYNRRRCGLSITDGCCAREKNIRPLYY